MGRVVEILVGVSALAGIATFLGVRTAVRRTLRTFGRKPDYQEGAYKKPVEQDEYDRRRGLIKSVPEAEEPVEGAPPERRTP